jgi:Zn-dependent protease with chaperone function
MLILITRFISFVCLTLHQVIVYSIGLLTFSVVGISVLGIDLISKGIEGVLQSPDWKVFLYSIALLVVLAILFMTTRLGSGLLRSFFIIRKPTLREEEKLNAALELVQTAYKKKYGSELKIDAYIVDSPTLNGFALGASTVALNRTVVNDTDVEEISAVLAHEAAHLHYGDGLFNALAFGAGSHLQIFFNGRGKENDKGHDDNSKASWFDLFRLPLMFVLLLAAPLLWVSYLMDRYSNWKIEYRADNFADELGFGEGLIKFLERLAGLDVRENHGFTRAYTYSHPATASRIDAIERKRLEA